MEEDPRPSRREVILRGAAAMGAGVLGAKGTAEAADVPKHESAPRVPESAETLKGDISLQFAQALSDEFTALGGTEPSPEFWQRMDAAVQRYAAEYEREYYPPEKDIDPEKRPPSKIFALEAIDHALKAALMVSDGRVYPLLYDTYARRKKEIGTTHFLWPKLPEA